MFRSDYMLHTPEDAPPSLKQVEFNTISSSFGGLATKVTALHTELAYFPTQEIPGPLAYSNHPLFTNNFESGTPYSRGFLKQNKAVETLTAGLMAANKAYYVGGSGVRTNPPLPTCVLFLVQDNEHNVFDQFALSSHLQKKNVLSFRLPTSKILAYTHIPSKEENPHRPLIYTPPANPSHQYEVTVVYFRALYAPTEYDTPTSWAARHHLERSAAIKCPSILLHLSGSKKIQQVLTSRPPDTNHLKKFLLNHSDAALENLRSTFAPQYSLSTEEGISLATNPTTAENHVLKPQREGGGNNIYRHKIPNFLASLPKEQWKQYILMELIHPPLAAKNTVLRSDGVVVSGNVISELGIFGTCLWRGGKDGKGVEILHNEEGGYLLRTKGKDSDEGGVAAGFSSLDSVILYEEVKKT
jgi:glutathione synthase